MYAGDVNPEIRASLLSACGLYSQKSLYSPKKQKKKIKNVCGGRDLEQ